MDGLQACAIVRLSQDPELRYSREGKPFLTLNGAVADSKAVEGQPTWLRVIVFGDLAETLGQREPPLLKGVECYVEGRLKLERWTAKDTGEQRSGLSLAAWRCEILGAIGRQAPKRDRAPVAPASSRVAFGSRSDGAGATRLLDDEAPW